MSASQVERALDPGTTVGRYVISHQVGAGATGVVYAARDPELDRVVAVKVLRGNSDPRMQQRLRREAIAMAQLNHPNVVAVYDVGEFDARIFVAMEYVAGQTLAQWIAQNRSPREILDAYRAAGAGLAAAHAAGIVHRDFKPENVLVGNDGRVHVGDFGLARTIGRIGATGQVAFDPAATPSSASATGSPELPRLLGLTAPGTLLGTPYYLAPELYGGADAGPRSDQFSFCVALFAALHGERPFEGPTLDALRANVQAGRITEPRMAPRLPRRIRAALQRGLSADPTARFASLDDLLVELAPPRRRVARWTLGLVGTAMAGAALLAWVRSDPEDQRCTGAATLFASAWNPERRATVASAFTAVHAPYADDALVRVQAGLDRYAAQWISAHTDTCRATRIRGEQTEATLDLRMTCLERRRQAAAALAGTLATGDAATVRSAVAAVLALPDLSACGDLAALRQVVSPPSDPIVRRQIAALNAHLAEARASFDTGAFARARELIGPIATEAHALGYQPFEAEVRLVQGQIQRDLGDLPGAEASVQAAIWSAEAGRHDEIAATAWARLVFLIGYDRAEFARAESFVPRATAALARLGDNPAIEAELERSIGALAFRKGDTDAALAHADKAVVLAERAHGPEHLDVARMINGLAVIVLTRGDTARAIPLLEHTVQIFEKLLGPNHTSVARALLNLGSARVLGWDAAAAEPELRRGVAIWQAALGADNRDVADALASLSQGLREQGKLDEALQVARRAVAIAERVMGVDDSMLVGLLFELGLVELRLARFSDAESHLRRASAIASKVFAPDDSRQMNVIAALADSRALQSRWREAAALYEQAIPALQRRPGLHKQLGITETSYARVLIELHQPSRAIASLERLARTREQQRPQLRPMIDLTLARALWESGGDRQRACQLASDAHASAMQTTGMSPRDLEQIENWLASHHRC